MKLYPHQQTFIEKLREELAKHRHVLGCAPTGMGKTVVASFMVKNAMERGRRVYFMVHRLELLEQTSRTFNDMGIEHGFLRGGRWAHPERRVQIMSADTLKMRLEKIPPPDFLIADEVHHIVSAGQKKIYEWAKENAYIVGLSATPRRLDKKGFEEFFGALVLGPSVAWLIENGYLSKYRIFTAPVLPDTSGVRMKGSDYDPGELQALMDKKALYGQVADNWLRLARGKKTLSFCPTIETSENLVRELNESRIRASHVDAKTPRGLRKKLILDFADGKLDVLSNVGLFGEGFDLSSIAGKDVTVEAVIIYRHTASLSLHLQILGRALRRKSEPAIILDHVGNCLKHGLPDDDYEWSLTAPKKKKSAPKVSVRQCPTCHATFRPAPKCPECGYVFEAAPREGAEKLDGDLVEVTKSQAEILAEKRKKKQELIAARTEEELVTLGKSRGYKSPVFWARKIIEGRKTWKPKPRY